MNAIQARQLAAKIIASPAASYWLQNSLRAALKRDVVDAYHDAAALQNILHALMIEALGYEKEDLRNNAPMTAKERMVIEARVEADEERKFCGGF